MEGAKILRNIALVGAFWTGVTLLVTEANAQGVYDSNGKSVTVSPAMNPGTVPQAEINVESGGTSAESGNANTGGVQVQNVTVQAGADSAAAADSKSTNTNSNALDAINRVRTDAETSNNALLLQQIELNRLKAEQNRIKAINEFGSNLEERPGQCQGNACPLPAPAPCGAGPCVPSSPIIENNNTIINDSPITSVGKTNSVEIEEEVDEPTGSFLHDTKWGISPLLGMRWYGGDTMADISNSFVVGGALTADVNKWITAEGSFVYGKDEISGYTGLFGSGYWNETTRDSYEIGIGTKIGPHMNGFRPYLALGLGYLSQSYEFLNGSETTSNFTGNIGGGVDFQVAKNFAVGARADYQAVIGGKSNKTVDGYYTYDQVYGDQSDRYRLGATATVMF